MQQQLTDVSTQLAKRYSSYWPATKLVALAFYNQKEVYLFNHPNFTGLFDLCEIVAKDDQFNGADGLILYQDYPTAIVNLALHNTYEDLFAIGAHELFHGLQYLANEQRFADELLAITYPLQVENIYLRTHERLALYDAVTANNPDQFKRMLVKFIAYREKRSTLICHFLDYELATETIEGPAWYIEMKAKADQFNLMLAEVVASECSSYFDPYQSNVSLRRSCYFSGLLLAMVMDRLDQDWKADFLTKTDTLYDLVKQTADNFNQSLPTISSEVTDSEQKLIDEIKTTRAKAFQEIECSENQVFIIGKINLISFDPMNMQPADNKLLHENRLSITIDKIPYHIQQPVISYFNEDFRQTSKLHFSLNKQPIHNGDKITLPNIGTFTGSYTVKDGIHYITI